MKFICENRHCRWIGDESELLNAPNPFDAGETISACPQCKDICNLAGACDEPECRRAATCGTPTPEGYRLTCNDHVPKGQPDTIAASVKRH